MRRETFFVYGTLQFPAIAAAVTGRRLTGRPAVLDGYARFGVQDAPFPGIAPQADAFVEGLIYTDVDALARKRIDAFEGEPYRRESVLVRTTPDAAPIEAWTYVIRPRWRTALIATGWDPEAFERQWHDTYVRRLDKARRKGELG